MARTKGTAHQCKPFTYRFFANGAPPEDRQLTDQDRNNLYDAEILYMDLHVGRFLDIAPMILQHVGFPVPSSMQGSASFETTHPTVAETYPLPYISKEGDWRVLFDGLFKLYWNSLGNHKLVNLADDPKEMLNLFEQEAARSERMQSLLSTYLDSLPGPADAGPPVELDEETGRALKNLGYVQ